MITNRFASMPDPNMLPTDPAKRQIAIFMFQHPWLAGKLGKLNVLAMTPEQADTTIEMIRGLLGIKPFNTEVLRYQSVDDE
jgi:hypothetical protein